MTLDILGSGHSSVGGIAWYLVGADHERAFWAVRDLVADAADAASYEVREFTPGATYAESATVSGDLARAVADLCVSIRAVGDLNFDDLARARDLYWTYRTTK